MNEKSEMYYAENPSASHDLHLIHYQVDSDELSFHTDSGVFSKMRVDYGSTVLIKAMKTLSLSPKNVLDMGTGYGPIGLFAARTWPKAQIDMVDVNQRALDLAKKNANLNQIKNVNIFASNIYEELDPDKKYDLILTNPPIRAGKQVVSEILAKSYDYLNANGKILVVIQKKQGEPSARKLLTTTFGNCQIVKRDKGYYILLAQK